MDNIIKGYKVFSPNWTCGGFPYEIGKTYEIDSKPQLCGSGFIFCKKAADCFNVYDFNSSNKVAEVEALGNVETDGVKSYTNKIKLLRELTWHEVLDLVNTGKDCTGYSNSGDRNCGNWNTGDYNIGDWNTGDFNKASFAVGCFNTKNKTLSFFDKPTDVTFSQWRSSRAYLLLRRIDFKPVSWVHFEDMSDEEKENHTEAEKTMGYLKTCDNSDCFIKWWDELSDEEKDIIKAIPNFDVDKFYDITGIKVEVGK